MKVIRKVALFLVFCGLVTLMNVEASWAEKKGEAVNDILTAEELSLPVSDQLAILETKIKKLREEKGTNKIPDSRNKFYLNERKKYQNELDDPSVSEERKEQIREEIRAKMQKKFKGAFGANNELKQYYDLRRELRKKSGVVQSY